MSVSFRAAGSWENGATGLTADETVAIPAAQVTGDLILVIACWKDFGITAQVSGYTELIEQADGSVGTGNGLGSMKIGVWYKVATSDTEADPTVDFSTTTNLLGEATVLVFSKSGSLWGTPVAVQAAWTASAGPATISAGSTVTVPDGGAVIGIAAIRDDSGTFTRGTTDIAATSGVTWNGNYTEAPATHASTTTGNDMACDAGYRLVTTGGSGITLQQSIQALSASETGNLVWVVIGEAVNPSGTGAITTAATTTSGAGTETFTATGAVTTAAATTSGAGEEVFTATGAASLAAATVSGAGAEVFTATGAPSLAATTVAGSGEHTESEVEPSGTGAITTAATTVSGAGALELTATGAATLQAPTVAGTGSLDITGSGTVVLAAAVAAGEGLHIENATGTGAIALPALTVAGTGQAPATGGRGGRVRTVRIDDDDVAELDLVPLF